RSAGGGSGSSLYDAATSARASRHGDGGHSTVPSLTWCSQLVAWYRPARNSNDSVSTWSLLVLLGGLALEVDLEDRRAAERLLAGQRLDRRLELGLELGALGQAPAGGARDAQLDQIEIARGAEPEP